MGQSQTREITVATSEADSFSVGEVVKVGAKQRMGIMAVVLCYVVPLILLVTVLAVAIALGVAEGLAAVVSLCSLALYYGVVWLFRNQIAGRVSFTISKL
jgi:sigma-E factor negative regulatory protein RseC